MSETYSLLIAPETLRAHLEHPGWAVFDCRHALLDKAYGPKAYAEGHIPGARYADVDKDLSSPVGPGTGRHPLPDWDAFVAWLGRMGVANDTQVVAYDDATGSIASRLWWMLRALGHTRVAVLDGGFARWQREGGPVTVAAPTPTPVRFSGRPDPASMVSHDEVERLRTHADVRIIDARGAERYRGEEEPIDPVAGHIPGAANLPYTENLGPDNTFLPPERLKALLESRLRGTAPEAAIHYCGSGVSACHNLLAQAVAGLPMGRLYPGSWSQWCADPSRPVATDEE